MATLVIPGLHAGGASGQRGRSFSSGRGGRIVVPEEQSGILVVPLLLVELDIPTHLRL